MVALALAVLAFGPMASIAGAASSAGSTTDASPGNYPNAAIAEIAMSYLGRWGAQACIDAGKGAYPGGTSGGQCKTFVNCVVWMASGGSQWAINGYASAFERVGGVRVDDPALARTGDIIQVGGDRGSRSGMQHTAIVLAYLGDGIFDVVDSNYGQWEHVSRHDWDPGDDYTIWRMGALSDDMLWLAPAVGANAGSAVVVPTVARSPRWLDLRQVTKVAAILFP